MCDREAIVFMRDREAIDAFENCAQNSAAQRVAAGPRKSASKSKKCVTVNILL
jgi:hypothetical protein